MNERVAGPQQTPNTTTIISIGVLLLVLTGLLVYPLRAQEASRLAFTGAIWDDHSFTIDGYLLGIDRAVVNGQTYSDKAPGQPLLAVPAYALGRGIGMDRAVQPNVHSNLTLWWITFSSATIPAIVLLLLARNLAASINAKHADLAAVAIATGTIILPFSTVLFGHILAAALLLGGFQQARRETFRSAWYAGALTSLAVVVEYQSLLGAVLILGWVVVFRRPHTLRFLLGTVPATGLLLIYNAAVFGSPYSISYQWRAFDGVRESAGDVASNLADSIFENIAMLFVSGRGFLVATPVVLIAIAGSLALSHDRRNRDLGWFGIAMFCVFLLIPVLWSNPWGGESPGARYMVPALAFLTPGLTMAWRRWPILTFGTWLISLTTMVLATYTDALVLTRTDWRGIAVWIQLALESAWVPNLLGIALGTPGTTTFGVAVLATVAALIGVYSKTVEWNSAKDSW